MQFDTRPNRRFFEDDRLPPEGHVDTHGFLTPKGVDVTRSIDQLLDMQLSLIVAPPWFGKTFVAEGLYQFLRAEREGEPNDFGFGTNIHATLFHQFGQGSLTEPSWWAEWQQQESQRACWIVDAIDEDWHAGRKAIFGILERVEHLTREKRVKLSLILFCRKNEQPPEVRRKLEDMLATDAHVVTLELAPPDEKEALRIAGSREALGNVKRLILQNNFGSVGGYPAVIQQLARRSPDEIISRKQLWRMVLENRLRGGRRERQDVQSIPDLCYRFAAAKRAAAVTLFAGLPELDDGSGQSRSPAAINTLFSKAVPSFDVLQHAAHSLRHTDLITRTATGYRFRERHVQEWFAAFALEDLSLIRISPVLSRNDEPFSHLRGVMSILSEISEVEEVRTRITKIHGGVCPPSDALPWKLQDAVDRLDHLESLARGSPYGLTLWEKSGLEHLAVPGIATELAQRLSDPQRTTHVKLILLDVAEAVGATDTLPIVEQIIRDTTSDDRLRSNASYTLYRLGSEEHFAGLTSFVKSAKPNTREQRVVVANIIRGLLHHNIWRFREAYPNTPPGDPGIGDASSVVEHDLRERMTVEDARWLLNEFDWETASDERIRRDPTLRVYHSHHGPLSFAFHAADLLLTQDPPEQQDFELLQGVVLARDEGYLLKKLADNVVRITAENLEARRTLFRAGLEHNPDGKGESGWRWQWALTIDDFDWLADVADTEAARSPWLWKHLLILVYGADVDSPTLERIRGKVQRANPKILSVFDRGREDAKKEQKRWQEEQERFAGEEENLHFELKGVVLRFLDESDLTPKERLHKLSWVCFLEDRFRPNNVVGRFCDLNVELQKRVLLECSEALGSVEPTPVPDAKSYPMGILYEAEAFATVVRRVTDYKLDAEQVRRWLPCTLVFSAPDMSDVLTCCFETDRAVTEDVVLDTIRRELRLDEQGSNNASNLPVEYWSGRFIGKVSEAVADESLPVAARCDLLRLIAVRSPKTADPLARKWLDMYAENPDDRKAKRLAAIDALLFSDPVTAIYELAKVVTDFSGDVIQDMSALCWRPGEDGPIIESWPTEAMERLTFLLHEVFPVDLDPPEERGQAHVVGPTDDLSRLRDTIPRVLFERGQPEDLASLERLSKGVSPVRDWYAWAQANKVAAKVITVRPTLDGIVPWKDVVRLLDDAEYRLIRDSSDLQQALLEQIHDIAKTIKKHLAMLYRSGTNFQLRQHEDALQAYFHCRLTDRLKGRVLASKTAIFLNRETQESSEKKFDIKVEAPTLEGTAAVVVLELKWSDHSEISTSLPEQLGQRYLLANDLTQGIYLVGWFKPGRWTDTDGLNAPDDIDSPQCWAQALQRQADAFNLEHTSINIVASVIDIRRNEK